MKKTIVFILSAALFLCSCKYNNIKYSDDVFYVSEENSNISSQELSTTAEKLSFDENDYYIGRENQNPVYITLSDNTSTSSGNNVTISKNKITINSKGTYILSGTLSDGEIIVDTDSNSIVRLVFNGINVKNSSSSAVYIKQAKKTIISLESGTQNFLEDGLKYVFEDNVTDEPSACLYSKDDLTINGEGTLTVKGNYNDAITCRDILKITEGNFDISSLDDAVIGRDFLQIKNGSFKITSKGDGIKSSNSEGGTKGSIIIENGKFDITSSKDAIQTENYILIENGTFNISSGGGSSDVVSNSDFPEKNNFQNSFSDTESTKGIKSVNNIFITGGSFTIDSLDDNIHSNGNITVNGGSFKISTSDDGFHADNILTINNGDINISKSYEGLEGTSVIINGGTVNLKASDDGINSAGGSDTGESTGFFGRDNFKGGPMGKTSSLNCNITINGGKITVDADGDGIDANGSIYMNNGEIYINGPVNGGNGALDYDSEFIIKDGLLIAAGSAEMLQLPSQNSDVNIISYTSSGYISETIYVKDLKGSVIMSFSPSKTFRNIIFAGKSLNNNTSYTLYSGNTKISDFTVSDTITYIGQNKGMGNFH